MYQDSKRTCRTIVLLIKPFVWRRSRWRCRRGLLNCSLLLWGEGGGLIVLFFYYVQDCTCIASVLIEGGP